jgi:hypothetical protein
MDALEFDNFWVFLDLFLYRNISLSRKLSPPIVIKVPARNTQQLQKVESVQEKVQICRLHQRTGGPLKGDRAIRTQDRREVPSPL